ncbi:MAG: DEAD/DEAH box helicase, partial [Armatimonadetes bacterium]|nr:DEAD/DEAH box helicase [Armatimonadota bacterium]
MDIGRFLQHIEQSPDYRGQIVYVREYEARAARCADTTEPLAAPVRQALAAMGIEALYSHQAEAVDRARRGEDVLVVTGPASGKSLCYQVPLLETLLSDPDATALLVFPTKALCQDQFGALRRLLDAADMSDVFSGVYDGDTPGDLRRRLREGARVIFTNPDMLHAALMPRHARWAEFLAHLRLMVLDEIHVYSGIFGSNVANLLRRLWRVCAHYGSRPQLLGCSATLSNPAELAETLTGRPMGIVDDDGSPRGPRRYVFWNPPRIRARDWRGRRSANVEAHELMSELIRREVPTITFSKAKMTAEMIHRYVTENLQRTAPALAGKVTPYRGGYLPAERREIERRLFSGELLGVSCTRALELGIDVGGLDAAILVGYPGTRASFFQQSGRVGRQDREALVVLVGLDTAINQYIMSHPEYIFGHPVEEAVIDPDNPFVVTQHLRCACHELPLNDD